MVYVPSSEATDGLARVIYQAKDGGSSKTFLALDWLAQLVTHIPSKGEQLVLDSWLLLQQIPGHA